MCKYIVGCIFLLSSSLGLMASCNCKHIYNWHCTFGKIQITASEKLNDVTMSKLNYLAQMNNASLDLNDSTSSIRTFNGHGVSLINGYFEYLLKACHGFMLSTNGAYDPTLTPLVRYYAQVPAKSWASTDTSTLHDLIKLNNFYSYTEWSNPIGDSVFYTIETEDVKYQLNFTYTDQAFLIYQFQSVLDSSHVSEYEIHTTNCHYVKLPDLALQAAEYFLPFKKMSTDPVIYLQGRKSLAYCTFYSTNHNKAGDFIAVSNKTYRPTFTKRKQIEICGENILMTACLGIAALQQTDMDARTAYMNQFANIIYSVK